MTFWKKTNDSQFYAQIESQEGDAKSNGKEEELDEDQTATNCTVEVNDLRYSSSLQSENIEHDIHSLATVKNYISKYILPEEGFKV